MKKSFIFGTVLAVVASIILGVTGSIYSQGSRPQVGKYAKVYLGEEQTKVTLVRVGPPEKSEYLVEIFGVDHPWDNTIFLHKLVDVSSPGRERVEYQMQVDGNTFTTLIIRDGGWGELYLKDRAGKPIRIWYSQEESQQIMPEHVLTAYENQQEKSK